MKRASIAGLGVLAALLVAAPMASAHDGGGFGGQGGPRGEGGFGNGNAGTVAEAPGRAFGVGVAGAPRGWWGEHGGEAPDGPSDIHVVAGTVASVDATGNTLAVTLRGCRNADPASTSSHRGGRGDDDGGVPKNVTVKADADTLIVRNGKEAALGEIVAGDKVAAEIATEEDTTLEQALATPAWLIVAKSAAVKQTFYGFGGSIVSVDGANSKVTVNVTKATASARKLLGAGAKQLVFTVDAKTFILKGGSKVAIGDLAAGDLVGVGIRAAKTATLDDVVATPAKRILALNSTTSASSARKARAARRLALRAAGVRR
jgi:hypothetical protein